MSENKSGKNVVEWAFRASLLVLGTTIALNLAIAYLRPLIPWIGGVSAMILVIWIVVAVVRWRRSRW